MSAARRGKRSAFACSSARNRRRWPRPDLAAEAIAELVERALAMAAEAPDDPYAGLAPAKFIAVPPFADLNSVDAAELR